MSFRVHSVGPESVLVDFGRLGSRSLGVPVSGAADRTAMALGNALVGNSPETPALEISLAGPTLEATGQHACVVFGAPFAVRLNEDQPVPAGKSFNIQPGDILTLGATEVGLRAYLCVQGGFQSKVILGSRSALHAIQKGQELVCGDPGAPGLPSRFLPRELDVWLLTNPRPLRVLKGTHVQPSDSESLAHGVYTVSRDCNRMGIRLTGKPLERKPEEMVSAPVCPGTIQVTPDGQLIVLGVDAQTIGGYPRLAQVIAADLDVLAQLRPGDATSFVWTDLATATELFSSHQARVQEWVTRLLNAWV